MEKKKLEILAPAGSFESLKAAVHAGTDAVYMGGSRFGARAYAQNPEGDRLLEAIDYAHLYGVKLYLTVNTLLKDKELEGELYDYLKPCVEHGLDAVIVQDTGVMKCIQRWFPELDIHASTQMTLCGVGGVELLKEEGAHRAVLARELSLDEIHEIYEKTGMELECLYMEHYAIAIRVSACSAVSWEAEAATGAVVHSHVVWPIRPLTMEKIFQAKSRIS